MKIYGDYNNFFTEFAQKNNFLNPNKKNSNIMGKIHDLTLFVNQISEDQVHISQEGLDYIKGNLYRTENAPDYAPMSQNEQELYDYIQSHLDVHTLSTVDTRTEIISKDLWKAYEDLQSNETDYLDVDRHVKNLTDTYSSIYTKIVEGYKDGTREVWTKDNSTDDHFNGIEFVNNGMIERYRKLTMEEELAALDKAYEKYAKEIDASLDYAFMMEEVSPSALKTMEDLRKIVEERFHRNAARELEAEKNAAQEQELKAIKEKHERPEKMSIYRMLMEAKSDWIKQFTDRQTNDISISKQGTLGQKL